MWRVLLAAVEGALQDTSRRKKDWGVGLGQRWVGGQPSATADRRGDTIAVGRYFTVDATRLEQAIKRIASKSERFAVDLSEDWIEAARGRRSE